jgi:hypothetical protein
MYLVKQTRHETVTKLDISYLRFIRNSVVMYSRHSEKKTLASSYVGENKYFGPSAIKIASRLYHMLFNDHVTTTVKNGDGAE